MTLKKLNPYNGINTMCSQHSKWMTTCQATMKTRSSESDGRSDVTDCFDLRFVLIALTGLDCPDCRDWFRLP